MYYFNRNWKNYSIISILDLLFKLVNILYSLNHNLSVITIILICKLIRWFYTICFHMVYIMKYIVNK